MSAPKPCRWPDCGGLRPYLTGLADLLRGSLGENLTGVYLHGSLATGSYYFPKSDMDLLAVVEQPLAPDTARTLNKALAAYSDTRPTAGDIELSVITAQTAKTAPNPTPYELHYSELWHDRILSGGVSYGGERFDPDLPAHLYSVKHRGARICGQPIDDVFGDVSREAFLDAVLSDTEDILKHENLIQSPYYGLLNLCRVFQLLVTKETYPFSKEEGGVWGLTYFPQRFQPLIAKALAVYRSDAHTAPEARKTGGTAWDIPALLAFRDYARGALPALLAGAGLPVQFKNGE